MSAPVTEAHRELAYAILFATEDGHAGPNETAQLIADSEAREVALHRHIATQLAAVLNAAGAPEFANADHASQWAKKISGLTAERDKLRAQNDQFGDNLSAVGAVYNAEKARAERAEAEAERYRLVTLRLDAELATERARLRQLALDACRAAAIVPLVWYPTEYYVNPNDLGKINKQQVDACVAAIDAAMKEGAK